MIWSAGPGVNWPIFEGGRLVANVRIRELRTREMLLNYRRTILVALQEAEDALSNYVGQQGSVAKLRVAVQASATALKLAQDRYDKGLVDFLNVLDAERSLYDLEDQVASNDEAAVVQLVALYKALGGGWEKYAESHPANPSVPPTTFTDLWRMMTSTSFDATLP